MQVLSGAFDTLSHTMETYLGQSDRDNISDDVALAIMRSTVYRRIVQDAEAKFARLGKEVFGMDGAGAVRLCTAGTRRCKADGTKIPGRSCS